MRSPSATLPTGCAAAGPFATAWPEHEPPLSLAERQKLQQLLTARGYYSGDIDGNLGSGSREAIRNYQLAIGCHARRDRHRSGSCSFWKLNGKVVDMGARKLAGRGRGAK